MEHSDGRRTKVLLGLKGGQTELGHTISYTPMPACSDTNGRWESGFQRDSRPIFALCGSPRSIPVPGRGRLFADLMAALHSLSVEEAASALEGIARVPDCRSGGKVSIRGRWSEGAEGEYTRRAVHSGSTVSASQGPHIPLKHRVCLFLLLIRLNKGKQESLRDRHMVVGQKIEPDASAYKKAVVHQVVQRLFPIV